jgi:large subunit ribosomal protein L33
MWCCDAIFALNRGRLILLRKVKAKKYFRKAGGAVMRVKITLACTECKQRNYNTMKNKKNDPDRLEMNKYCRFCKKHTLHKETK